MATAMSNRLAYNRERLAKLSQSVIFRQPERLYDGYLQKIDQLQLRLKQGMREVYGQGDIQLQGLRHRLEAMSPLHRIERYQDRIFQDKRLLTRRMEQVLKEPKIQVQGLSEALLMLDTSRIIARGYAMVKQDDQILDSVAKVKEGDPLSLIMRDGQLEVEVKHVERIARYLGSSRENLGQGHASRWY